MSPITEPLSDVIGLGPIASRPAAGIAGRLYFATDTGERSRDDGTAWVIIPAPTVGSPLGTWNYSRTRGGTPADKGMRLSANVVVGTPNGFRIDDNDVTGADRSPYLAQVASGDIIFIDDHNGNIARGTVDGAPVDNGGWWTFPFTPSGAYPMAAEPPNGSNVTFGWQAAAGGSGTGAATELAYTEFTAPVNVTATSEAAANTIVTGTAVTLDGATTVWVEFDAPYFQNPAADNNFFAWLYDGSTSLGFIGLFTTATGDFSGGNHRTPIRVRRRLTPSAGAHTYSVRSSVNSGTGVVGAGAGGAGNAVPGFIRITKV